jgi:hypothetical protein
MPAMDEPAETPKEATPPPRAAAGQPCSCLPTVVGVILGVTLSFFLARRFFGDSTPEITADSLREAEQRWTKADIRDYDVEVEVKSRQTETYRVEVRDGTSQQAFRNGRPLKQLRTFETWSVPGMFETIHTDLANSDRTKNPRVPRMTLQAEFDPETGMPLKYRRIEWEYTSIEISWRVTNFEKK